MHAHVSQPEARLPHARSSCCCGGAEHSFDAPRLLVRAKQVTAVDVLPYMGSVEALLGAVAGVLKRGGRFAFTIEALEPHLPLPAAVARRHTQGLSRRDEWGGR